MGGLWTPMMPWSHRRAATTKNKPVRILTINQTTDISKKYKKQKENAKISIPNKVGASIKS